MNQNDKAARLQESQYGFPYHYIPELRPGKFSGLRYWAWSFRYLGGIQLALDLLAKEQFTSLVDIGCGDGRFLRELGQNFPDKRLLGVDVSEQAIRFARAFNPDIEFMPLDVTTTPLPQQFDAATMIEVMEHIPPDKLDDFLKAVARCLRKDGRLVVTVPHQNKPLIKKHYQHFTAEKLLTVLKPHFTDITVTPFDVSASRSPLVYVIERILGSKGRWLLLTNPRLLHLFYAWYIKRYLYARNESQCERIAVVCTVR